MYAEHFSLQYFRLYVTIFVFKIGIIEITLIVIFLFLVKILVKNFILFTKIGFLGF